MNIKQQILQEIEQVPEQTLEEILMFIRSLKVRTPVNKDSKALIAFQQSLEERREVYQQLADS